jgi:hypothetical protein
LQYSSVRSPPLLERWYMSSLRQATDSTEDEFTANDSAVSFLALQPDSNPRLMCCTGLLVFISTRGRTILMVEQTVPRPLLSVHCLMLSGFSSIRSSTTYTVPVS